MAAGQGDGPAAGCTTEDRDGADVTFAQIRQRAYELWERNHRPDGYEVTFWLIAERELRAERRHAESRRPHEDGSAGGGRDEGAS